MSHYNNNTINYTKKSDKDYTKKWSNKGSLLNLRKM